MESMNVFRILGDLSHATSKLILIYSIHRNKSAEGVSLLTQLLYILVFGTRYLDLFWVAPWTSWWNTVFKLFYISTSLYVVYLMMKVYPRTREKERAWKLATYSLAGSAFSSPFVMLALQKKWSFSEWLWTLSIELESVCILPQLLLLRQTSVPTVIDSFYLVTLGVYRAFYLLNWVWRGAAEGSFDATSVVFGVVQTALYVDFAWVYWTRQRVKLRGGTVVDSDDLNKSFLVNRIIGNRGRASSDDDLTEEDEALARQENGTIRPPAARSGSSSWGARGISVSADDTLHDYQASKNNGRANGHPSAYADAAAEGDAQMVDPSHFEDDDDDDVDAPPPPPPPAKDGPKRRSSDSSKKGKADGLPEYEVGSSAGEWQDDHGGK